MAVYLALKELWRNRGRFFLISLVIALITTLVLFVAALGEGLGNGNKEYLEKLNGDLIVYKDKVDLAIGTSRLDRAQLNDVRRVPGVAEAGPISFSSVSLIHGGGKQPINISLIGVEPGRPGEPPVVVGEQLRNRREKEAIVDRNIVLRTGLKVGDRFTIKSIQGTDEEFYVLTVRGISDGRQYSLAPSVVVPVLAFEDIKPKVNVNDSRAELISNIVAVQLDNPADLKAMARQIESQVSDVKVVDRKTAYENTPGYSAQQSTLNTQRGFALLIGVLVIGGFFQIQILQKVAQVGMLKAIGTPNGTIAIASTLQIIAVTALGVGIGVLATFLLKLSFPPTVPIVFSTNSALAGIISLMLIGPIGGLVSIRYSLRIEPLMALGLAQ